MQEEASFAIEHTEDALAEARRDLAAIAAELRVVRETLELARQDGVRMASAHQHEKDRLMEVHQLALGRLIEGHQLELLQQAERHPQEIASVQASTVLQQQHHDAGQLRLVGPWSIVFGSTGKFLSRAFSTFLCALLFCRMLVAGSRRLMTGR